MPEKPKKQEEESGEGAPLWIISFADMSSLLMAFFVMLSTFSSYGPDETLKFQKIIKNSLRANFGWLTKPARSAMLPSVSSGQPEAGSEKPTLDQDWGKSWLKETQPKDFRENKVFQIESNKIFWANGTALSSQGRDFLNVLANFVKNVPERIVVSENGPGDKDELSISRAIVIIKNLEKQGIPKEKCGIGSKFMMFSETAQKERMIEIAILDESIYQ